MSDFQASDFSERLLVARVRAGHTMRSAADLVGITVQAYHKYEHDKSMPTSASLLKFCEAFGCSMEWLLYPAPLDFLSTDTAPEGRHAKYWVRAALNEIAMEKCIQPTPQKEPQK